VSALAALLLGAELVAYVPPAPVVGVWQWTPGENATAHAVYVSRNGGAFDLVAGVPMPETSIQIDASLVDGLAVHDRLELRIEPLAPGTGAAPGPLSDVSDPVRFQATPDGDQDRAVGLRDQGALRQAFGRWICPNGDRAVPAQPAPCP
jgi:hypothetical protein